MFYTERYGLARARFFELLDLGDMYNSWWFLGLLALFCLNLGEYDGEIELTTSQAGLANAYTLSKVFTGTVVVQIDETQDATDPTVGVVLGNDFKNEMLSAAEVAQIKSKEEVIF